MSMTIDAVSSSASSAYAESVAARHLMLVEAAHTARLEATANVQSQRAQQTNSAQQLTAKQNAAQRIANTSALANTTTGSSAPQAVNAQTSTSAQTVPTASAHTDSTASWASTQAELSSPNLPVNVQALAAESLNNHLAQYELQTLGTTGKWTNTFYAVNLSPIDMYTKTKSPMMKVTPVASVQAAQNDLLPSA
jgi:hypothetical protein